MTPRPDPERFRLRCKKVVGDEKHPISGELVRGRPEERAARGAVSERLDRDNDIGSHTGVLALEVTQHEPAPVSEPLPGS